MKNQDIRQAARKARVKLWQIADVLEIADSTFCRRLRKELPQTDKEKIFAIIAKLTKEVE